MNETPRERATRAFEADELNRQIESVREMYQRGIDRTYDKKNLFCYVRATSYTNYGRRHWWALRGAISNFVAVHFSLPFRRTAYALFGMVYLPIDGYLRRRRYRKEFEADKTYYKTGFHPLCNNNKKPPFTVLPK